MPMMHAHCRRRSFAGARGDLGWPGMATAKLRRAVRVWFLLRAVLPSRGHRRQRRSRQDLRIMPSPSACASAGEAKHDLAVDNRRGAILAGKATILAGATSASSTSRFVSAGSTSSRTPAGRSPRLLPAHRATPSPCSAQRPRATVPSSAFRPPPPSPRRLRSTCVTTAASAEAPTTMPSMSACA